MLLGHPGLILYTENFTLGPKLKPLRESSFLAWSKDQCHRMPTDPVFDGVVRMIYLKPISSLLKLQQFRTRRTLRLTSTQVQLHQGPMAVARLNQILLPPLMTSTPFWHIV